MGLQKRGDMPLKTYWFWTNFCKERSELGYFELYDHDPKFCKDTTHKHYEDKGEFWGFNTTLSLEYMKSIMLIKDLRSFLFRMQDYYSTRSVMS